MMVLGNIFQPNSDWRFDPVIEAWTKLAGRHRFLRETKIAMSVASVPEAIPPNVGVLLAAMRGLQAGPLCIVLPRCGDAPAILALLYSICAFREGLPPKIAEVGKLRFKVGDSVAVAPSGHVYEYRGIWDEDPRYFLLGVQGETGIRNLPMEAMLRLSRTDKSRPKGKLETPLRSPERSGLDRLIGAQTFDNPSLFSLQSILVGNRTRFEEAVASLWFSTEGDGRRPECVEKLLPLGRLRESSATHQILVESSLDSGIPIVASTHSLDKASRYVAGLRGARPLVVIDGAGSCKDQQAWDNLSDACRVVVFANEAEHDDISLLAARRCPVWKIPPAALADRTAGSATPLSQLSRWASIRSRLSVNVDTVPETVLDEAAKRLRGLDRMLREDADSKAAKAAVRAWGLLNQAARSLGKCPAETRHSLMEWIDAVERDLDSATLWTAAEDMATLVFCVATAKAVLLGDAGHPAPKTEILAARLRGSTRPAVLACDAAHEAALKGWLSSCGFEGVPVYTPSSLEQAEEHSNLVCPAWPRSSGLQKAARLLCAPAIDLICHPFEAAWALSARRRLLRPHGYSSMARAEISAILSRGAGVAVGAEDESDLPGETREEECSPWEFERIVGSVRKGGAASAPPAEQVSARYVSFHGPTYAYLSAPHKVPVANAVLGPQLRHVSMPERTIDLLRPDDLVVFPEGGAKGVLQEMADRHLGREAKRLRALSRYWRDALKRWGKGAVEFESAARELGCSRHSATINHWFEDSLQIGPGERVDVEIIAKVTGDSVLLASLDDVWNAITRLRGEHLGAGSRLQNQLIEGVAKNGARVNDDGSRIEVQGLGAVWIVRIDYIAERAEARGRNEVNRLLWEKGTL